MPPPIRSAEGLSPAAELSARSATKGKLLASVCLLAPSRASADLLSFAGERNGKLNRQGAGRLHP